MIITESARRKIHARIVAKNYWLLGMGLHDRIVYALIVDRQTIELTAGIHNRTVKQIQTLYDKVIKRCDYIIDWALRMKKDGILLDPAKEVDILDVSNWVHPKKMPAEFNHKKPIEVPAVHVFELDLTTRAKRILWHLKITSLEELAKTPIETFKAVRGCNIGTIKDIQRELQRFGVNPSL